MKKLAMVVVLCVSVVLTSSAFSAVGQIDRMVNMQYGWTGSVGGSMAGTYNDVAGHRQVNYGSGIGVFAAKSSGGISVFRADTGWAAENLSAAITATYTRIDDIANGSNLGWYNGLAAVKATGGIDVIYGVEPEGYNPWITKSITGSYVDVTGHPWANGNGLGFFAAKSGGGIDFFRGDTGWVAESLSGLTQKYVSISAEYIDPAVGWYKCLFGVRDTGQIDIIGNVDVANGQTPFIYTTINGSYLDVSGAKFANPGANGGFFASRADGGVERFDITGYSYGLVSGITGKYSRISDDVLGAELGAGGILYGVVVPEPATVAILGLGSLLALRRKRA